MLFGEVIEVRIKGYNGKVLFKGFYRLNNKKDLISLFRILENKFSVDIVKINDGVKEDIGWW